MLIRVLYFAATRDLVGQAEEQLQLPPAISTVEALSEHLQGLHPALQGRLNAVRFAVNEEFAGAQRQLAAGDTVALIPPTAGG